MSSPQLENGFTRIANEILEALARVYLSPYESRVFWFVVRRTYGFNKKVDRISLSQFAAGTGIPPRNVRRAAKSLLDRNILIAQKPKPQTVIYGIQKNHERWLEPLSLQTVSEQTVSPEVQTSVSAEQGTSVSADRHKRHKDNTKDNGAADAAFETAWSCYPKRAGGNSKKNAKAKWMARVRSGVDPHEIIEGLERYTRYVRATGSEGTQYVKQAEVFFGPGEHWKDDWKIPADSVSRQDDHGGFVG